MISRHIFDEEKMEVDRQMWQSFCARIDTQGRFMIVFVSF